MSNEILISVVTIAFSALISSLAYFYKIRREATKSYKKLLYNLLEIRYAILMSLFQPEEATKKYIEHFINRLNRKGLNLNSQEFPDELFQIINKHFKNVANELTINIEHSLLKSYEVALIEMSITNPVLAYTLHGQEKLEKVFAISHNYEKEFVEYLNTASKDDIFNKKLLNGIGDIKLDVIQETIEAFTDDILLVAKKCGLFDYIKTRNIIKHGISIENLYNFEELDLAMDKIYTDLLNN